MPQGKPGPEKGTSRRSWGRMRVIGSGRVQAAYTGPDGLVHKAPATFATKDDAAGWLRDERRMIEADTWTPPADRQKRKYERGLPLKVYADQWLPRHRRPDGQPLKARTVHHYRKLLDLLILPDLGEMPVKLLTPDVVQSWWAALGDETPTYNAHAYSLLHLILDAAVDDHLLTTNPCMIRGAAKVRTVHRSVPATLDELATIVENMPERQQLAILLMAWCALRFGEVTELRRRDIDFKNQRIKVRRAVVMVGRERQVTTPKSDAGIRDVAIPPHLIPVIRDHLERFAQEGRDGLLFPSAKGEHLPQATLNGKPARDRVVKGRAVHESGSGFCRARDLAGRPDLRLHDLRHTGAVLAAQTGATLAELMARLGHSTPAAAMRYQHAARDRDKAIAAALSDMADVADVELLDSRRKA